MGAFGDEGGHFAVVAAVAEVDLQDLGLERFFGEAVVLSQQFPHGLGAEGEAVEASFQFEDVGAGKGAGWGGFGRGGTGGGGPGGIGFIQCHGSHFGDDVRACLMSQVKKELFHAALDHAPWGPSIAKSGAVSSGTATHTLSAELWQGLG